MDRLTRQGLDYTQKITWSEQNAELIALDLGYVLSPRFLETYNDFIVTTVVGAQIMDYLFVLAKNHFGNIQPPLEKINGKIK